jgi:hypothetical protein
MTHHNNAIDGIQYYSGSSSVSDYSDASTSSMDSSLAAITKDSFIITDLIVHKGFDQPMPLRGQPIQFPNPTEPVSNEDWETER